MAESETGQERTEEATPRRREKARSEGRIARSQELSSAVVLLGGVGAVGLGGASTIAVMLTTVTHGGGRWIGVDWSSEAMASVLLREVMWQALLGAMPIIVAISGLATLANVVQARGVLSAHPLKPKWSHISPLSGLKRVVSWQSIFNLVKSILKLVFLGGITYFTLANAWPEILSLSQHMPPEVVHVIERLSIKLALVTGLAFLLISAGDYLFQVYQYERQLRMTRQEVVQEHKESEGDPLMKSRIRSIAVALARKRMLSDVAGADVVVTNPTRFAVALKYDVAVAGAPVVVALGARKLAERIRAIALTAGVPIVENKPLAQALMATGKVGQPVPPALYVAVAEVIAFVYRKRRNLPGRLGPLVAR